jgi:cell division protein FtsQ
MNRSLAAPRPRPIASGRAHPAADVLPVPLRVLPLTGVADLTRAGVAFAWRRPRLRILLLAVVIALPVLGGGWLWLRHSPFVSVQQVRITGVHGPEAEAVRAALVAAAHHMSTLDVSAGSLRAAVAPLRVVRELRAVPSFPHGLRIEVIEQLPVAALTVAGRRTAVAADGVVLGPALLSGSLPAVSGYHEPVAGRRVSAPNLLAALAVLGATPAPLARLVARVYTGPEGLTVAMRNGLLAYFGDASRPHAKWLSLARVLADPSSAGASYVDVRVPSRPAAGFPAGVTPPEASAAAAVGSSEQPGGSSESTIASLAAGLTAGSGQASQATGPAAGSSPAGAPASGATLEPAADATGETAFPTEAEQAQAGGATGGQ